MEPGSQSPSGWDKKLSVFSCFLPGTTATYQFFFPYQKEISETSMKTEGPLIDIEEKEEERSDCLDEIGAQYSSISGGSGPLFTRWSCISRRWGLV
ncbi:hypothetical protein EMIT07CA2_30349 [Brevibacillus sp. IT-7CA2]